VETLDISSRSTQRPAGHPTMVLKRSQDGCTSLGYSESCSQEPGKRIPFGHLLFGYSSWPGFEHRLTRFSVPLHLKPLIRRWAEGGDGLGDVVKSFL
jgi:hypothetical protein